MVDPERLWTNILSREPDRIRAMWQTLDPEEQAAVHMHLVSMVTETGWTDPQRISAQAALDALQDVFSDDDSTTDT